MSTFFEQVEPLKNEALQAIESASNLEALELARIQFLGTKGAFTGLMKGLGALSKEEKPLAGKTLNIAKRDLESAFETRKSALELESP